MGSPVSLAQEHYSNINVKLEIAEFCKDRWVAVHCIKEDGSLVFRRYLAERPLVIEKVEDLPALFERLGRRLRSIYATANKYRKIKKIEDVSDLENISRCTPTWDVDSTLPNWKETIRVAERIIKILESEGIRESVYLKWSGNGCHIHIHEEALSEEVLMRANPLDLAYAIVEYVRIRLEAEMVDELTSWGIKVENKMDPGRVFTCPLSLHRTLDAVCICMKPQELEEFSPEWIRPEKFRHNDDWRNFKKGEADGLALKSLEHIGGYPLIRRRRTRRTKRLDQQIVEWLKKE
ncbi:MAG: hypothetical protein QW486_06410 [Candidatus Bathyarchaeia archaeon]|nr:hypothetical protein [Candidatus Bathyarchaeota archaeon]